MFSRCRRLAPFTVVPFAATLLGGTAMAQVASPPNSLIVDPQQGATPRPIAPAPSPTPPATTTAAPAPSASPVAPVQAGPAITLQPLRGQAGPVIADQPLPPRAQGGLPSPSDNPLAIDAKTDPILRLAIATADPQTFSAAIRAVVARNPAAGEADARRDETVAARNEARATQYPVADLSLSHFRVIDRDFSNDPQNVLERSRPRKRTDALLRIQQPLVDFGLSKNRIGAGNRRVEASIAAIDDTAQQVAMRGIATWYQLFAYRALVSLSQGFVEGQTALRGAIEQRVKQGYAAQGDVAQVESYIAAASAQLAQYRRQLATAEAQYQALTGAPAPDGFGRAPAAVVNVSRERAEADAEASPGVRSARSAAEAARYDAKAAKSTAYPGVSLGVDAGRYGLIENDRDYDIRGTVTLTQRVGGGIDQRIDQAAARARGAEATYERIRQDAVRDAAIAWADVAALEEAEAAIRDNYLATRQSRDVLAERFRVSRGTLFDLLGAEANYFNVAARYVESVTELDIARYTLLARRGKLLDAFGIAPAGLDRR
ncbi:TolC family protein [Sphingomonas donggukensis]|uniref:TolC family protein n=1 Tax=Sphingomonas donggukensis TaxID=2949093 RepID=A0ABY4TXK0_9SPHN|nr:TolC family protein [Sphingomonas donggukensis]URW76227.1 TolC family protein [Sphingomonas donggukensis]